MKVTKQECCKPQGFKPYSLCLDIETAADEAALKGLSAWSSTAARAVAELIKRESTSYTDNFTTAHCEHILSRIYNALNTRN